MSPIRLPHGEEARLVSRILEHHEDRIVCEAAVPADSPWVADGRCPSFVALEAAAQAAALLGGVQARAGTGGFLVRARRLDCARAELEADTPLQVLVTRAGSAPPLHVFDVRVSDANGAIVEGQLSIYLEESSGHISEKQNH